MTDRDILCSFSSGAVVVASGLGVSHGWRSRSSTQGETVRAKLWHVRLPCLDHTVVVVCRVRYRGVL